MKVVDKKNKTFKVVPEGKRVIGCMERKDEFDYRDLHSIKNVYKAVMLQAMYYDGNNAPDEVTATAYCDDRDEFDEKIGVEVCSSKLEQRNHIYMAKLYDKAYERLTRGAKIAYDLCIKHMNKAKAIEEDMVKMYGRDAE